MSKFWTLAFLLSFFSTSSWARSWDHHYFQIAGGVGLPSIEIKNPDDTTAYYSGLQFEGKAIFPILAGDLMALSGSLGFKYIDLENTANSSTQKEISTHKGFGAGLNFSFGRFALFADYHQLKADSTSTGAIVSNSSYEYSPLTYGLVLKIPKRSFSFDLGYSISSATLEAKETGLSEDVDLKGQTFFIHFTWNAGASFGRIVSETIE